MAQRSALAGGGGEVCTQAKGVPRVTSHKAAVPVHVHVHVHVHVRLHVHVHVRVRVYICGARMHACTPQG